MPNTMNRHRRDLRVVINKIIFGIARCVRHFCIFGRRLDLQKQQRLAGETRIPAGTYDVRLRTEGGFHGRYTAKYGDFHKGMLHVQDVPGFEYILIHTGNTDEHTEGCLLVGDTSQQNITKQGFIGSSGDAYKRIYPDIADHLVDGGEVQITYIDYDN